MPPSLSQKYHGYMVIACCQPRNPIVCTPSNIDPSTIEQGSQLHREYL